MNNFNCKFPGLSTSTLAETTRRILSVSPTVNISSTFATVSPENLTSLISISGRMPVKNVSRDFNMENPRPVSHLGMNQMNNSVPADDGLWQTSSPAMGGNIYHTTTTNYSNFTESTNRQHLLTSNRAFFVCHFVTKCYMQI